MKITEFILYPEQEESISRVQVLDDQKNIIEEIDFDESGNQLLKVCSQFNEFKKATEIIQYDEFNELIEKKNIEYNQEQKVESTIIEFPDGSLSKEIRVKEDNSVTIKTVNEDDEFEGSVQNILDSKDQVIEQIITNFMNKVDSRMFYEYNDKGETSKIIKKDPKGRFLKAYTFAYDESGNKIREEELNKKEQIIDRVIHQYEAQNLISSKSANESVYYQYENNELIKEEHLNPDGSSNIINFKHQNNQLISEKHYNVPQGNATEDSFLVLQKRYLYE